MNISEDKFLKRMLLYRLQYLIAGIVSITVWYAIFVFFCFLDYKYRTAVVFRMIGKNVLIAAPAIVFSIFNTVTYFCRQYLANKYGVEMFADLDQDWLREHQAFDAKAFGEIFARLIQCRKVAWPYMLAVIIPVAFINMYLATAVGVVYFIAYFYYRLTYFDTAISYKVPRAFGGGGTVISKIIDPEFNDKLDKLAKKLDQKK
ncbi:MAG: hypothetical protein LBE95_02745 [Holosporaceae bacterium]|jgi:hypothetical protein|nr:hypothetical protein [Holosporaceae bacterium]